MAKKVKFPLNMGKKSGTDEDIMVRNIEELKENYNTEKVMWYFREGKLLTWLEDRYCDNEAEQVRELMDRDCKDAAKVGKIFGIEIKEDIDVEEIENRRKKLEKLRDITGDDEVLNNVDHVAFLQEELDELVYRGANKIYLFDDPDNFISFPFIIDTDIENVQYIGVNKPRASIFYDCDGLVWDNDNDIVSIKGKNIFVEKCDVENVVISYEPKAENDIAECNDDFEIVHDGGKVCLKKYKGNSEIVKIPDNVNVIGKDAFYNCKSVKKIIVPDSVFEIGGWAFSNCENLESVNIPFGVTKIEYSTFAYCKNLTTINLPPNLIEIKGNAFYGCDSFKLKITYHGRTYSISQIDILYGYINSYKGV